MSTSAFGKRSVAKHFDIKLWHKWLTSSQSKTGPNLFHLFTAMVAIEVLNFFTIFSFCYVLVFICVCELLYMYFSLVYLFLSREKS